MINPNLESKLYEIWNYDYESSELIAIVKVFNDEFKNFVKWIDSKGWQYKEASEVRWWYHLRKDIAYEDKKRKAKDKYNRSHHPERYPVVPVYIQKYYDRSVAKAALPIFVDMFFNNGSSVKQDNKGNIKIRKYKDETSNKE